MDFVTDILDELVRVVDDRYGRRAAWIALIVALLAIVAVIWFALVYFAG